MGSEPRSTWLWALRQAQQIVLSVRVRFRLEVLVACRALGNNNLNVVISDPHEEGPFTGFDELNGRLLV